MRRLSYLLLLILLANCSAPEESNDSDSILSRLNGMESISGTDKYLPSPFVTPGDRAYLVGHQDGTFPPLGWHITGEMGGLWAHPIKLLDGFTASLESSQEKLCLSQADEFVNYPFANAHIYNDPYNTRVTRVQFSPDQYPAIVVEYTFENLLDEGQEYLFEFNAIADLRPTWLGERTDMIDAPDRISWNEDKGVLVASDSLNPWHVVIGSPDKELRYDLNPGTCVDTLDDNSVDGSLTWIVDLPANGSKTITIVIAGGVGGLDSDMQIHATVMENYRAQFDQKRDKYADLERKSRLVLPDDPVLEQTFRWIKYNTDWLVQEVPGVGRGITAGIPDYPWWFGADSEYALQGAMMVGQESTVFETIDLIHQISEDTNGNGRVVHEVSSNGAVFNPGNINETPQFVSLIWRIYEWTGDREFLEKYYPFLQKGMVWLLEETDLDGNLLPDGFGMMEIHGLDSEMIDVAAYTQKAFDDLAKMSTVLGKTAEAEDYQNKARQLAEIIETDYWVEDFKSYADFIGTATQADHLIEDAIRRADSLGKPWAVEELEATRGDIRKLAPNQKQGFVLHHNWVVNTPMETGIASEEHAIAALETGGEFVNPFGVFVTGIDRDESAGDDMGSFQTNRKIFTYIGAVMTLPTGVQAVAENNYGRPDEALDYIQRMTRSFSYALPGSMYEVSPDFGMMTQAWNIYSYAVPIVNQFFGIRPKADEKRIVVRPKLPGSWNNAAIENVQIGDNSISVSFERSETEERYTITQTGTWTISFEFSDQVKILADGDGSGYMELRDDGTAVYTTQESSFNMVVSRIAE